MIALDAHRQVSVGHDEGARLRCDLRRDRRRSGRLAPIVGVARVVSAAQGVALAIGDDVDADLEAVAPWGPESVSSLRHEARRASDLVRSNHEGRMPGKSAR